MSSAAARLKVLHFMPDLAMGGGQQVLLRHVPFWVEAGTEQVVVYFRPAQTLRSAFEAAGAHTMYVPHRDLRDWPRTFNTLSRYIAEEKVDILHTNGTLVDKLSGHWMSLTGTKPMVTTLHGVRPRPVPIPRRPRALIQHANDRVNRRLERFLEPRTVNRFVAVSDAVKEDWQTSLEALGVPPTRVQVIYSGVSVEQFATPDPQRLERLRSELGLGAGPILISAGRFHRGKNLHILPAVVEHVKTKYPDVRLLLAGNGDEEASLRSLVTNMGLDDAVQFLGMRTDLSDLFAVSDVFLFPSGQEGFGLVVLEALAAGLSVVTTRLPSLQKLWSREVGIELADSITPEAFAAAVDQILSRPQEARAKASVGQDVVRTEWSASGSAAKYLQVYREIAGERPGFRE